MTRYARTANKQTAAKTERKTRKTRTPKPSSQKTATKLIPPLVKSGDGEDDIEANLSFLITFIGGNIYDDYIKHVINPRIKNKLKLQTIANVNSPIKGIEIIPGQRSVYLGKGMSGTHYTSTVDGIHIFNSYDKKIQKRDSDHFCQTFALMYVIHDIFPNSKIAKAFNQLIPFEYMHNAYIAKNVACDIIAEFAKKFYIYELNYILVAFEIDPETGTKITDRSSQNHKINPEIHERPDNFNIENFIKYCKNITQEDMENSTIKNQIYLIAP
jgi:hypothetical protein